MTTKKVDLVVYEDGKRKVIGDAVVDLDGLQDQYLDLSGVVTDPEYKLRLSDTCSVSLNVTPFCDGLTQKTQTEPTEVELVEPIKIKGKAAGL